LIDDLTAKCSGIRSLRGKYEGEKTRREKKGTRHGPYRLKDRICLLPEIVDSS
jgi:hypothetical protein